jgi:tetratricopeptide (TPR) repeat protein
MLKEVAEAIKREDYRTAQELLQTLHQIESDNPWVLYYQARVDEAQGYLDKAGLIYREILQNPTNPKLIAQTRQGIQRLEQIHRQAREEEIQAQLEARELAKSSVDSSDIGVLLLEPMSSSEKQIVAPAFAKIMNIDPYTARLQLPSRSWRLYRVGGMGELAYYVQSLQEAGIPCFCQSFERLNQVRIYPVAYFESVIPEVQVKGATRQGALESIAFKWGEVSQCVNGLLPLFEDYQDLGSRGSSQRKIKTQDYAQVCDLHLKKKNVILRLCDQNYEFQQGIRFSERQQGKGEPTTLRDNWNHLLHYLKTQTPELPVYDEFTPFADTALEFAEALRPIVSHLDILRIEETPRDGIFEIYSRLAYLKL